MKNNLSILLATYNGEKYLSEHIDSLLKQTYQDFILYVRDDGSNDHTVDILEHYQELHPQKIKLMADAVKHRGAMNGFFYMLQEVNSYYYMFCDQDDVWLPNKIEVAMKKMKETEALSPNIPIVVHTDLYVVNKNLDIIQPSFWKIMKLKVNLLQEFKYLATCNCVTGCTMMINERAKQVSFPVPEGCLMHDFWISLASARSGKVVNVPQSTILYRQHGFNVVGMQDRSIKYFIDKLFSVVSTLKSQRR